MGLSNLSLKHLATEKGHLLMPERMRQLCMGCWPLRVKSFCTSTSTHNFIFFIVVNKSAGDSNLCSQSIDGTPQYSSALNCNMRPFHSIWYAEAGIHHLQFSSVAQLCPTVCDSKLQHARPPCPSPTPRVYPNPRPSSQWYHPTISSSVVLFSSCPKSLPASGSFPLSQLFTWGGQRIGVSASASVLPMNTQDWSPLGWISWISLQPKGLSRVFSNTTVLKHQFFSAQLSSQSNSHIHTWPLEKP